MDPSHDMRVSFYAQVVEFLYEIGQERAAVLHRHLVDFIRQEKNWKLQSWTEDWSVSSDVNALAMRDTLRELGTLWRDKGKVFQQGMIKRILPNGKTGFIHAADSGQNYYFSFRDVDSKSRKKAVEGSAVRFTLIERENLKRHRLEKNAVDVTME